MLEAIEKGGVELRCVSQHISVADLEAISAELEPNKIKAVILQECDIDAAGAKALAEGIKSCIALQVVVLMGNKIGSAGAASIAGCLEASPCGIHRLDLSDTDLSSKGAAALSNALIKNSSVRMLNLSATSIKDAGAAEIARMLGSNSALE